MIVRLATKYKEIEVSKVNQAIECIMTNNLQPNGLPSWKTPSTGTSRTKNEDRDDNVAAFVAAALKAAHSLSYSYSFSESTQ